MPKPTNIVVTYKDAKGAEGQTIINIPTSEDISLDEMLAMAEWHTRDMAALSDAEIIRCSLIIDVVPLGTHPGQPNSDLEAGAEFVFRADNGFTTQIRIPAFREEYFVSGTPEVDLSEGDVADFVAAMIDGYGTDLGTPPSGYADVTTSRGEDITSLSSSKKSFQRSRV